MYWKWFIIITISPLISRQILHAEFTKTLQKDSHRRRLVTMTMIMIMALLVHVGRMLARLIRRSQ